MLPATLSLLVLLAPPPPAEAPTTQPATAPAGGAAAGAGDAGKVKVVSVTGAAQKLIASAEKPTWQPLQAGELLPETTVIRTGLRSEVVLEFEDRAEVTVHTATKMGIAEFRKQAGAAKVRLGLKYGSLRSNVKPGRGANDFNVKTPVATLSVRGTRDEIGFTPDFGLSVKGLTGRAELTADAGRAKEVLGGESLLRQPDTRRMALSIVLSMMRRDPRMTLPGATKPEVKTVTYNAQGRGILGLTGGALKTKQILWNRWRRLLPSPHQDDRIVIYDGPGDEQ